MKRARGANVLWLMTDEQRTDSLGCYGSAWARTPNLDRLAEQGVRFQTALTPSPICGPARSAILSGRPPHETGVWSNEQVDGVVRDDGGDAPQPALPLTTIFANAGYQTASFGKHHHLTEPPQAFQTQFHNAFEHAELGEQMNGDLWLSEEVGYFRYADRWDPSRFDVVQYPPEPFPWLLAGRFPGDWEQTAEAQVVAAGKRWLAMATTSSDPFLLRLSFNGPHTPVVPPAPWDTCIPLDAVPAAGPSDLPRDSPGWLRDYARIASSSRLSAAELRRMRQAYHGEVAFIDWLIGGLLDWMDAQGLLENLVIAFCSDHGCHLGDHGLIQKQTFFEPVVNVPCIFWAPGLIAPRDPVETPVQTVGLLPTLLDVVGLEAPQELSRLSLAETLTAGADPRTEPVFSEFMPLREVRPCDRLGLVRDGTWKLSARLGDEPDEIMLVDLEQDPQEEVNLADVPSARPVRDRLTQVIMERMAVH